MRQNADKRLILDAHNDSLILRQVRDDPMDLADVNPIYQVDLPRLRSGGMGCLFCMVGDNSLQQSGLLIDAARRDVPDARGRLAVLRTAAEVRRAHAEDRSPSCSPLRDKRCSMSIWSTCATGTV